MSSVSNAVLRLTDVTKQYPGVLALDALCMEIEPGEVRALLGKNGAGKSSTVKILSGAILPDRGSIEVDGIPVRITDPASALNQGIATVYQEISLVPSMTVAENILLGRWKKTTRVPFLIDHKEGLSIAADVLNRLKISIDPRTPVERFNVAQQQLVEIAKAVSQQPRVLILDEPTSALPEEQISLVHDVVRTLSAMGTAIIYVTHRLHEIPRIADKVTVLRDGKHVATIEIEEATPARITEMMVGHNWAGMGFERNYVQQGEPILSVRGLSTKTKLKNISLDLFQGEVLGLAGLLSSGRTELLSAIFGVDPISEGSVAIDGEPISPLSPSRMIAMGVGLTAEDRKRDGLVLPFPVQSNATLAAVERISDGVFLNFRKINELAREVVESLDVKTPSLMEPVNKLSGGNQQKIVIGNWLNTQPRILLMDEPSRGIDVAAKKQIFELVRELAKGGMAVIFVSSEIEEVYDVSDRILVIHDGEIVGNYKHDEISLNGLVAKAMNVED